MIVIVDYGMGNLRSVHHKVGKIASDVKISSKPEDVEAADKLILPGVGQYAAGMGNLVGYGLAEALNRKVVGEGTPVLGICLGMQLLTEHGEEGDADGLGWLGGETRRFRLQGQGLRVPHVGWNTVKVKRQTPLFDGIPSDYRFYFTHSYHVSCADEEDVLATTVYGYEFVSAVQRGNIFGVQFHPEKSHRGGLKVIENFLNL